MYSQKPYSSVPYSSLGLPASSGTPFSQDDWPNPVRAKQATVTQLTWTDAFKLPLQQVLPSNQYDWPVPAGPRRVIDLVTWVNPALFTVAPEIPNIMQYDWPNPRGPQRVVDLLSWIQPLTPSAMVFVPPKAPSQTDWPNPRTTRRGPADWIAGSTLIMSAPAPVISRARNRDFPNPRGPIRSALFLQINSVLRPPEPAVPSPEEMLVNLSGRVRFLKNEVVKTRFLAKNPNT